MQPDQVIEVFAVGDTTLRLTHNYNDDSRSVVTRDGVKLLRFDSSLGVHQGGRKIGVLTSRDDVWGFESLEGGGKFTTTQSINDWHWRNLQRAEVEVAQHLLM